MPNTLFLDLASYVITVTIEGKAADNSLLHRSTTLLLVLLCKPHAGYTFDQTEVLKPNPARERKPSVLLMKNTITV